MCAGALTAITAAAGEIALGAVDVALAGGVEHMGHHPMGAEVDFNPRFVAESIVDQSAAVMGQTAENLHDRFPEITKEHADAYAVRSQQRATAAWENGAVSDTVVPMAVFTDDGLGRRGPRRVPAPGYDDGGARRPADAVPRGRTRDCRQLGRPD